MTQLSGLSNHCSCVGEGSLGAARDEDHPAREHLRTLQMIPKHHQVSANKKEEKTKYQRISANWMLKETHREPGKHFILHCSISAVHP